jgi:hypothetical protein
MMTRMWIKRVVPTSNAPNLEVDKQSGLGTIDRLN